MSSNEEKGSKMKRKLDNADGGRKDEPSKNSKKQGDKKNHKNKRKQGESSEEKKWQPKSILQDSSDGPANKKRALRRQRNAQKPNFEAVCQSKLLWNELREKKCSDERRAELVGELHGALLGKYKEVALKHDASRLVQAVVQFGSEAQRMAILEEIGKGSVFVELCRSTYAHYVVVKLVEYTRSKEGIRKLTEALRGNICALATHSVAARVVELALMNMKTQQAASLRLELYGREFAVFVDETLKEVLAHNQTLSEGDSPDKKHAPVSMRPTLSVLLQLRPTRSEQILAHVSGVVGKLILKGLLPFQYAHELVCEYAECCTEAQFQELLPSVIEHSLTLLSTRPGTKVVCNAAIRGGAKERRRLLKIVKGHAAALLAHRDAYLAVIVLCEVTDDTVALQNSLLAELCVVPTSEDIARGQQFSANPFLDEEVEEEEAEEDGAEEDSDNESDDLVVKPVKSDTEDLSAFSPLLGVCLGANSSKLLLRLIYGEEANGFFDPLELAVLAADSESSKKDPQVRRDELVSFLEEPLNQVVMDHAEALLSSRQGGAVLTAFFSKVSIARTSDAATTIASVAVPNMLDDAIAHAVLQSTLKCEATNEDNITPLATALLQVFEESPQHLSCVCDSNRAAFVVNALLAVEAVQKPLCSLLQDARQDIMEAAEKSKGAALVSETLDKLCPTAAPTPNAKKAKTSTPAVKTPKTTKAPSGASKSEVSKPSRAVVKGNDTPMSEKKFSPLATRSARKKRETNK